MCLSCVSLAGCTVIELRRNRAPAGLVDVVLSYCHNCLNDRTLRPLLPYFKSKGVGVISASFSSMGMFTKQVVYPKTYPTLKPTLLVKPYTSPS